MALTISTDNPLAGHGVTYNVRSPAGAIQKHTTISLESNGVKVVVAAIDWHTLAPNALHMVGAEQKVGEFLARARPNRKFVLEGATYDSLVLGGKTYEWQKTSMTPLHDTKLVATVEQHSNGSSTLHVVKEPAATPLLDAIVVSMILMWRIMQPTYTSHSGVGYDLHGSSVERDGQTGEP